MYCAKNVSLIDGMQQIADIVVESYKSDLKYDFESLEKLKQKDYVLKEDLHYLWVARKCGTFLEPEHDLFYKDSFTQSVYIAYEKTENYFLLDITDVTNLTGDIYYIPDPSLQHGDFTRNEYVPIVYDVKYSSGYSQSFSTNDYNHCKYRLAHKYGHIEEVSKFLSDEDLSLLDLHLFALRLRRETSAKAITLEKMLTMLKSKTKERQFN